MPGMLFDPPNTTIVPKNTTIVPKTPGVTVSPQDVAGAQFLIDQIKAGKSPPLYGGFSPFSLYPKAS